jgi:hypothetical protein
VHGELEALARGARVAGAGAPRLPLSEQTEESHWQTRVSNQSVAYDSCFSVPEDE